MSRMRKAPTAARTARAPRPVVRAAPESEERGSAGTVRGEWEPEGGGRADRVESARAELAAAGLGGLESEEQEPAGTVRGELEPEGVGRADRVESARAELAAAGLGGLEREARVASTAELFPAVLVRCRAFREKSIAAAATGEVAPAALVPPRFGRGILASPFRRSAPANRTVPASKLAPGAPTTMFLARSTWATCSWRCIAQGTPPAEDRRAGTTESPTGNPESPTEGSSPAEDRRAGNPQPRVVRRNPQPRVVCRESPTRESPTEGSLPGSPRESENRRQSRGYEPWQPGCSTLCLPRLWSDPHPTIQH